MLRSPRDAAFLTFVLLALLGISAANVLTSPAVKPGAPPQAPWCPDGETPTFQFGFGALAQQVGAAIGTPVECEHGDDADDNIVQATTTGEAVYDWCTNTPEFTSGQEHWMLTPRGLVHWLGDTGAPAPQPVVRAPDLRQLCLT